MKTLSTLILLSVCIIINSQFIEKYYDYPEYDDVTYVAYDSLGEVIIYTIDTLIIVDSLRAINLLLHMLNEKNLVPVTIDNMPTNLTTNEKQKEY